MQPMKYIITSLFLLFSVSLMAQEEVTIIIDGTKGSFLINGVELSATSTLKDYTKALGKPERVVDYKEKPRLYAWDSKGIAIDMGERGSESPEQIKVSFTTEKNEEQQPQGKFTGTFTMNGTTLNAYSSPATFSSTDGVELNKMNPVAYMGSIDAMNLILIAEVGSRSNKLIHLSFGFKK